MSAVLLFEEFLVESGGGAMELLRILLKGNRLLRSSVVVQW